jgi:hypothetical protein
MWVTADSTLGFFRQRFVTAGANAMITVAVQGFANIYLNGDFVGNAVKLPTVTSYALTLKTDQENVIGIEVNSFVDDAQRGVLVDVRPTGL